jgi:hypothetical protein
MKKNRKLFGGVLEASNTQGEKGYSWLYGAHGPLSWSKNLNPQLLDLNAVVLDSAYYCFLL